MDKEQFDRINEGLEIAIIWGVEDVEDLDDGTDGALTLEERKEVLKRVKHNHDCNYGICWETLEYFIDEVKGERK